MRIYPDLTVPRLKAITADLLLLLALWLCWTLGTFVHDTVMELDVLGRGVERSGTQVGEAFRDAGNKVDGAPVVGDDLEDALRSAGSSTSEPVVEAGRKGREAVADLANLLGWLTGGLPALVVVLTVLPGRLRRARRILDARRVLGAGADPRGQELLAMRAAFSLPYGTLLRYTRDPIGDLAAGRVEPLLAALGAEHGLRAPRLTGSTGAAVAPV